MADNVQLRNYDPPLCEEETDNTKHKLRLQRSFKVRLSILPNNLF